MKKIFLTVASIFITLVSSPIFAQLEEPGDDPEAVPIGDYVWVLALIGLVYVFYKFRALSLQRK